ncbi:MAG: hypothetical protein ABI594_13470 [Ginsengibacter sp.]
MADTIKKTFWDFKAYEESEWFRKLVKGLLLLSVIYILMHFLTDWICPKLGYEYVKLDKAQMQQINTIYLDTTSHKKDSLEKKTDSEKTESQKTSSTINKTDPTSEKDTSNSAGEVNPKKLTSDSSLLINTRSFKRYQTNDSCNCTECTKEERVTCYLWNEFNHKLDTSQIYSIVQYLSCASTTEATNFLNNTRLKVQSYFWLIGPLVYLEIIFWTWFGVVCSLLFALGVLSKNRTTNPTDPTTYFDSSEIPSQVAKMLYAPVATLIIILGYNFFTDQNIVDISSSKGVLVFAFIGGFYSSRLISLLDKLKEILLPVSSTTGTQADVPALKNIVVQVQLDKSVENLWDLLKIDLPSLKLTLQKESSTQQAIALNIDSNQWPLFIFDYVQPGNYTIEALWSTKQGDQDINLKAEQKVEMKGTDQSITLKLTANTKAEDVQDANQKGKEGEEAPVGKPTEVETPVDIDITKKSEDNE